MTKGFILIKNVHTGTELGMWNLSSFGTYAWHAVTVHMYSVMWKHLHSYSACEVSCDMTKQISSSEVQLIGFMAWANPAERQGKERRTGHAGESR